METPNIQEQVSLSSIEQQKKEAGDFVAERIATLVKDGGVSSLDAVKVVYEEVKGNDYRKEQASAKVLEYLSMANEVAMRKGELDRVYPSVSSIINQSASNDDRYLVSA